MYLHTDITGLRHSIGLQLSKPAVSFDHLGCVPQTSLLPVAPAWMVVDMNFARCDSRVAHCGDIDESRAVHRSLSEGEVLWDVFLRQTQSANQRVDYMDMNTTAEIERVQPGKMPRDVRQ